MRLKLGARFPIHMLVFFCETSVEVKKQINFGQQLFSIVPIPRAQLSQEFEQSSIVPLDHVRGVPLHAIFGGWGSTKIESSSLLTWRA